MRISHDDVVNIAKLAELAVAEEDLATLVEQLDRIVDYVAQLDEVVIEDGGEAFLPGPAAVAWRRDEVNPEPLALPPAALAPEFRDGFFVVPRLAAMEPE